MEFIIREHNGSEPIEEWLKNGIKNHAKSKFGIVLDVEIKKEDAEETRPS